MADMLKVRAQKLKARCETVFIKVAGTNRMKELPAAMLPARQLDTFSTLLRVRILDRTTGFSKRYPRRFMGEIRFNGNRIVMSGKKAAVLAAASPKKWELQECPDLNLIGSSTCGLQTRMLIPSS